MTDQVVHHGSCHCGAIRFEVRAAPDIEALDCNCSICAKSGYLHLIVPRASFRLLAGAGRLSRYQFGSGIAEHLFCRVCGVKSYYIPRSNPDGIDVNVRCLAPETIGSLRIKPFDGRGAWDRSASAIAHLSEVAVSDVDVSSPANAAGPLPGGAPKARTDLRENRCEGRR